jgi:hypothetical protein
MTTWACFTKSLIRVFNPLIGQDTIHDLAPPKHNGSVNAYKFTAYVIHVGIASKLHQVTLNITVVNNYDNNDNGTDVDNSLLMMIGTN